MTTFIPPSPPVVPRPLKAKPKKAVVTPPTPPELEPEPVSKPEPLPPPKRLAPSLVHEKVDRRSMAEPANKPPVWTLEGLEAYLSARIDAGQRMMDERDASTKERFMSSEKAVTAAMAAAEKAIAAALAASEKAVLKAEAAADKRAEGSNEIRAAMIDQQAKFAERKETEFRIEALSARIDDRTKTTVRRLDSIENNMATALGRAAGISSTGGIIIGIIAAAASIATVVGGFALFIKH